jgi:selenocysteine-specific elongation factor
MVLPQTALLYVGSASVAVRLRPLGADTVRLTLEVPLPLRVGDRAVVRDPARQVLLGGAQVLDVRPPVLRRRGAAAARAVVLDEIRRPPTEADELRRRGLIRRADLEAMGVSSSTPPVVADWVADPAYWRELKTALADVTTAYLRARPLEAGMPIEAARQRLDLPDRLLLEALVEPPMLLRDGRIVRATGTDVLPPDIAAAIRKLTEEFAQAPFVAPDADRLAELGLGAREIAAAARLGALLRVEGSIVLLPGADRAAAQILASLDQPFTMSAARQALGTTRRVAIPLLELLDRQGVTRRLPDDRRVIIVTSA